MIAAAVGVCIGVVGGFIAGELVGEMDSTPVRDALRRFRKVEEDVDLEELEREVTVLLDHNPTTRKMGTSARVLEGGIVELLGTAQSESERDLAADLVRTNTSAPVVVNRILVEGLDVEGPVSAVTS